MANRTNMVKLEVAMHPVYRFASVMGGPEPPG